MADPNAQYTFRSWLRRGISTQQELAAGAPRASVSFEVAVGNAAPPPTSLALHGPRDIKGFVTDSIIRTWPKPGALVSAVLAWRDRYWSIAFRGYYTLLTVAAVAFVWFLNYWNLLGWRF